jgi:type IV secretion system protein VirB4
MNARLNAAGRRQQAMRRESPAALNLPYEGHLTRSIIDTTGGDLLCVLRIGGASFECADDSTINNRHNRLNRVVMSVADPRVTTWQHIVTTGENHYPDGEFPPGYASELNERYRQKVEGMRLMAHRLYLTVVLRPHRTRAEGVFAALLARHDHSLVAKLREQHVAEMEDIVRKLVASLGYYDAEPLEVYERNGVLFSEAGSFLQFLVTGRWSPVPLARVPLRHLIGGVRPIFGNEAVEVRNPSGTHFGAMLGIHSYPEATTPMFLDELLTLPFELVVTQSFEFKTKDEAVRSMGRARDRMEDAGDAATSQIDEIAEEQDAVASRRSVAGAHHYNVLVKASTMEELQLNVADVEAVLTEAGIKPAREDLAGEGAYWAQLPGNFAMRPRLSPINSRNLCGFIPLHSFPLGRRKGNHWGDALTVLVTAAGTPYYFSLHGSDPRAANGGNKKDVGNTMAMGPTGSGKTATLTFFLMMAQKFGVTSVLFSTDRDTEIAVRRLRGKVYRLRMNEPTGLAPFALDPQEPLTRRHLQMLVRRLVSRPMVTAAGAEVDTLPLTVLEEKQLDAAVDSVLQLEQRTARRLGRVLDFLPPGSLYERLARWCYARTEGREDGPLAWVFDNPVGTIADELGSVTTTAFDTTAYLDDPELRTPINMHLLHLSSRLVDGRRFLLWVSEFWKPLGDIHYAAYFKKALKTVRKLNGVVVLDTQSPSDALALPIARTLVEQCPTLILFPNDQADEVEYTKYAGCSKREFDLVKQDMPEGQGFFLLKQGKHSIVCRLPLDGMDDDMAVLSARSTTLGLMDGLIAQHGEDPDAWAPHFNRERIAS